MNALKFRGFTPTDLNMLMALCAKMRNQETNVISFNFEELEEIMQYKRKSHNRFIEDLKSMNRKLMQVTCDLDIDDENIMFVLFPTFRTNEKEGKLSVSVNADFTFILNELTKNFTRFELKEFTSLSSKYSKNLYRILKQWRSQGVTKVYSVEEFRELMDIPKSYGNKHIMDKVIKPSFDELQPYFSGLEVNIKRAKKRGAPLEGFIFSFDKELSESNIEEAKKSFSKARKNNKNSFNNFEQNKIDFDALEKAILSN